MFKAVGDRIVPIADWASRWLKGEVNVRLPILFECGVYFSKLPVNRDVAKELYRELILLGQWDILNCYADFINEEKSTTESLVTREMLQKTLAIFGYRRCTYDPSEDWKEFTERNLNKKAFGNRLFLFEHTKEEIYVGEKEKKLGKARALYYKAKVAKKDNKREKLFLKSALLGYVPAYSELAFTYEGLGNAEECIRWHEKGGEMGLQDSCLYLANLYSGTEKEYEYLLKCAFNPTTYPSTLLRLAKIIEGQLTAKKVKLTAEERAEKEGRLYDILARVIYENEEIDADKCDEVNDARLMLARLILENKIKGDGVLAILLLEVVQHHNITIDDALIGLADKYKVEERERIRGKIERKMNEAMLFLKHEENERGERDKAFSAPLREAERKEREEKERLEKERKEKALQEFVAEAKEYADKVREEKRLSWARPLDLGTTAEYKQLKTETKASHDKAVRLYQEALDSHGEEDTLNALVISAEAGHPRAIWELAKYYHDHDEEWASFWLEVCAKQGNLHRALTSKWKWNLHYCLLYANSKNENIRNFALEALGNLKIKSMTEEERAGIKGLADRKNLTAIKVYTDYIKYKDPRDYEWYIYIGAVLCDNDCVEKYINLVGGVSEDCPDGLVTLLESEKLKDNPYVKFEWYKIYQSGKLAEKFGVKADLEKAFKLLESIAVKKPSGEFKKKVYLEMGRCHENGIGTPVALYFASKYYRDYDSKKADSLLSQFNAMQEAEIRERKAVKLMEQYPSNALNNLLKTNPTWAKNIVNKYKLTDPEKLEEQLKARDEYLRFGFTLADMYALDGTFNEYQVRGAYIRKKREQEERAKKEEEDRIRLQKLEEENARIQKEFDRLIKEQSALNTPPVPATSPAPKNSQVSKNNAKSVSMATKKQQEQEALERVRQRYGYNPNGTYTDHLEYFFRMCEDKDNRGKVSEVLNDHNGLAKIYGVLAESIITTYQFEEILKEKINKVVGCFPSVTASSVNYTQNYHRYAEHDLAGLPIYGGALNIEVGFLQDIRYNNISTAPTSMDLFYDEYQKFHNHEISKFVDFNDYARETGLNYEVYSLEREEVANGKTAARKITRAIAKELLKQYKVVCPTLMGTRKGLKKYYRFIPLVATDVKVTFNFWGND